MKRVRAEDSSSSSSSSHDDDEISSDIDTSPHPPEVTLPITSDSWGVLVQDTQDQVVKYLDVGTKQCLAMTCKETLGRWYRDCETEEVVDTFKYLVSDSPWIYLKRVLQQKTRILYPQGSYLKHVASTQRSDKYEILTWLINTYYFNSESKIFIDREVHMILIKSFLVINDVAGITWVREQIWYEHDYAFGRHTDQYVREVGRYGHIEATNFLLDAVEYTYQHHQHTYLGLVRANFDSDSKGCYNWNVLFQSTRNWKLLLEAWQSDSSYDGLIGMVTNMLSGDAAYWGRFRVENVFKFIVGVWPLLSEATKKSITEDEKIKHIAFYEEIFKLKDISLAFKVWDLGLSLPSVLPVSFLSKTLFVTAVSDDTCSLDWLWSKGALKFNFGMKLYKYNIAKAVVRFVNTNDRTRVYKLIKWLESHPFHISTVILKLLRDTATLFELNHTQPFSNIRLSQKTLRAASATALGDPDSSSDFEDDD